MIPVPRRRASRGFTIVEAIVVIVIVGIIGGIVALFIRAPVQGYVDSVERAAATDEADLALRRIARDLRLALPNSVRVASDAGGTSIEFLLTSTGGRYLAVEDDVPNLPPLDFDDPAKRQFAVIGSTVQPIQVGNYIVVYNLGNPGGQSDTAPSDAYRYRAGVDTANVFDMNIARVGAVDLTNPNIPLVTLQDDNPFARQSVPMPSPGRRFQVVTTPVTYRCATLADGSLGVVRHWDYPITASQSVVPQGGRTAIIATRVGTCNGIFQYGSDATRRSALVILNLSLNVRAGGTTSLVRLVHQVHVDNTP
jgi:MSHA biogenesis protein MshO